MRSQKKSLSQSWTYKGMVKGGVLKKAQAVKTRHPERGNAGGSNLPSATWNFKN